MTKKTNNEVNTNYDELTGGLFPINFLHTYPEEAELQDEMLKGYCRGMVKLAESEEYKENEKLYECIGQVSYILNKGEEIDVIFYKYKQLLAERQKDLYGDRVVFLEGEIERIYETKEIRAIESTLYDELISLNNRTVSANKTYDTFMSENGLQVNYVVSCGM